MLNIVKSMLPGGIKRSLKTFLGIQQLQDRQEKILRKLDVISTKLYETDEDIRDDSKARWKASSPDEKLTWKMDLKGDAFIEKVAGYDAFKEDTAILEIGPGYGRLLKAINKLQLPFGKFMGVDISPNQVQYLEKEFGNEHIKYINADAESVKLEDQYDMLISSLVFKHIYPSCEKAVRNLAQYMKPGGRLFIDFIEGQRRFFQDDGVTYIRHYTREELQEMMEAAGFKMINFDEVLHTKGYPRLLVVAEKVGD